MKMICYNLKSGKYFNLQHMDKCQKLFKYALQFQVSEKNLKEVLYFADLEWIGSY
jgi:hypothetical protein